MEPQADQDEYAVTAILAGIRIPRQACLPERVPDRPVQALTNRHLITVRATGIPETLNIKNNDGPVNGSLLLHLPSLANQGAARYRFACEHMHARTQIVRTNPSYRNPTRVGARWRGG